VLTMLSDSCVIYLPGCSAGLLISAKAALQDRITEGLFRPGCVLQLHIPEFRLARWRRGSRRIVISINDYG